MESCDLQGLGLGDAGCWMFSDGCDWYLGTISLKVGSVQVMRKLLFSTIESALSHALLNC